MGSCSVGCRDHCPAGSIPCSWVTPNRPPALSSRQGAGNGAGRGGTPPRASQQRGLCVVLPGKSRWNSPAPVATSGTDPYGRARAWSSGSAGMGGMAALGVQIHPGGLWPRFMQQDSAPCCPAQPQYVPVQLQYVPAFPITPQFTPAHPSSPPALPSSPQYTPSSPPAASSSPQAHPSSTPV